MPMAMPRATRTSCWRSRPIGGDAPAEHQGGKGLEVRQPGLRPNLGVELALLSGLTKEALPLSVASVKDRPRPYQGWRRDHQASRLNEANPFEVGDDLWVKLRHSV